MEKNELNSVYKSFKNTTISYRAVLIPKKNGFRKILIPENSLKKLQKKILKDYLENKNLSSSCHSFTKGKSIISNANPHINKSCIIKLDIKDFFPTINEEKVFNIFKEDFSVSDSRLLTKLCTYKDELPQGAPTSPYISNLVMRNIDLKIDELISNFNKENYGVASYTRYADDITISGSPKLKKIIPIITKALKNEGFQINKEKIKIQRKGSRQKVTGIIVNEKLNIPKEYKNEVRKEIYYIKKHGIENHLKYLSHHKGVEYDENMYLRKLIGKIIYIKGINSDLGSVFYHQLVDCLSKKLLGYDSCPTLPIRYYNSLLKRLYPDKTNLDHSELDIDFFEKFSFKNIYVAKKQHRSNSYFFKSEQEYFEYCELEYEREKQNIEINDDYEDRDSSNPFEALDYDLEFYEELSNYWIDK